MSRTEQVEGGSPRLAVASDADDEVGDQQVAVQQAGASGPYDPPSENHHRQPFDPQVVAVQSPHEEPIDFAAIEADDVSPAGSPSPSPGTARFVYPGGSKPLAGYTIKRGVGHGGFGEIYYAVSDAGKEVALKLVRRNLDIELRGIRHCLNLKHPNLVALYDIRQDDEGDTWVVMEFVGGQSLEDAVATNPQGLPIDAALAWFHGIAAGVEYLHDRGIVHRDLKPANIFSDEGLVKVGDYGLSKFISCSRRSGHTESVGTVHYMAPEVANGRYGKEIDIYALGIMLYEILTGRVPFEGESVGEVLMKHLTAKPDVSILAEPYRSVVARALEKDPGKRFQSVAEMAAALPPATSGMGAPPRIPYPAGASMPGVGAAAGQGPAAARGPYVAASAEQVVMAEVADEEPILRAVKDGWHSLATSWREANLATPLKVIILVGVLFVLLTSHAVLVPAFIFLLLFYGAYRLIRALVIPSPSPRPMATGAHPFATPVTPASRDTLPHPSRHRQYGVAYAEHHKQWNRHRRAVDQPVAALVMRSRKQRLTELLGSMLMSSLACVVMCVVVVLIAVFLGGANGYSPRPQQCAWLLLMSIASSWAVIVPAKFWEGSRGEPMLRRFIMMVLGLGLGLLAFGLASVLMVDLPPSAQMGEPLNYNLPASFYAADGRPLAMAYLACFGSLMLLIRWWRQADPLRGTRLSLFSAMVAVVIAGLVAGVWQFPQPWLMMLAGAVSVSVQLTSPWLHPRNRKATAQGSHAEA